MAYLSVICNPNDTVRLRRIINEPKRGIGDSTVNNAARIADALGVSLYEVISHAGDYPVLSRATAKLNQFTMMIDELHNLREKVSPTELFETLVAKIGYVEYLSQDKDTFTVIAKKENEHGNKEQYTYEK